MAEALVGVPGVRAVLLGGSRGRGTAHAGSDVDLGVYYDAATLDVEALSELTASFNDSGHVEVAAPGEWGPWVNGGAWLREDGTDVDWILRDIARVTEQVERARRGEFAFHPQTGHPLGFLDVSYAGEAVTGKVLSDDGLIEELRAGSLLTQER